MKGRRPLTPRVRNVLALAETEAQARGHDYVGTEHLLLAILREDGGLAADAIRKAGASAAVKHQIDRLLESRAELPEDPVDLARVDPRTGLMRWSPGDERRLRERVARVRESRP